MLLSRSTCIFRQYPQCKLLAANAVYISEYNVTKSYKENKYKYEYKQSRNFRNFGHTRKKSRLLFALPIILSGIGTLSLIFDWQR